LLGAMIVSCFKTAKYKALSLIYLHAHPL